MALCLANSLISCGDFVPYDQLVRYKWWYRYGYMSSTGHCFDIGAATKRSIEKFETRQRKFGNDFAIAHEEIDHLSDSELLRKFNIECSESNAAGNGSLMRLAPVPLFFYQNPEKAVEYSGESSRITHGDVIACDACRYYAALIVAALRGENKDQLIDNQFYDTHKLWFGNKPLHPDIMKIAEGSYKKSGGYDDGIRGKGYVVNTVEAALWAFWKDDGSFEKGVLNAVNLGDDTDTTAAIYGQLAGAHYGYETLPDKWVKYLYAKDFIDYISSWITYEGHNWFLNHNALSHGTLINSRSNMSGPSLPSIKYFSTGSHYRSMTNLSSRILERKAIDPTGHLGYLYDGRRDRLTKLLDKSIQVKDSSVPLPIQCRIETGDKIERGSLLQFAGFDSELRLSVASNIVKPMGIASVIDYPFLINEHTRVFYYSFSVRQEGQIDEKAIHRLNTHSEATHIIVEVDWGIDVIVLLQLPFNHLKVIDETLLEMRNCLRNDTQLSTNTDPLHHIHSMHVYSNIACLMKAKTMVDLYDTILKIKRDINLHQPCSYTLNPLMMYRSTDNQDYPRCFSLGSQITRSIEDNLLRLSNIEKLWKTFSTDQIYNLLETHLKENVDAVKSRFGKLKKQCDDERTQYADKILKMRQDYEARQMMKSKDNMHRGLRQTIEDFEYDLSNLQEKARLIMDLRKNGFEYWNAKYCNIQKSDNEKTIQEKLMRGHRQRLLCSNDNLNEKYRTEFRSLLSQMRKEQEGNSNLSLVYVDFSYCLHELDTLKTIPANHYNETVGLKEYNTKAKTYLHDVTSTKTNVDHCVNILLLGKIGVGKSMFINMIQQYLKFNTYAEVMSNSSDLSPVIPFTYKTTGEDNSEEHFVQVGKPDPNENDDHVGHGKTQKCKSYWFDIEQGEKLQIIDTPGIGSIDGKASDQRRMEQILCYISDLTHINAICVLIESEDKESAVYSMLLKQLLKILGDEAAGNIIFCFTKYSSRLMVGDKDKARIQAMRESLPNQILFNQENTSVLDHSFFFHLISKYASDYQKTNDERSWSLSRSSWMHLLKYVRKDLSSFAIHPVLQKVDYTRIKVIQMVRPILESIRNILRNDILTEKSAPPVFLSLRPKPIPYPSAICYGCELDYVQFNGLLIPHSKSHECLVECKTCSCRLSEHKKIDYVLEYKLVDRSSFKFDDMEVLKKGLLDASVSFAYFLIHVDENSAADPFWTYFNDMIHEESCLSIYSKLNAYLRDQLASHRRQYQSQLKQMTDRNEGYNVKFLGKWIEWVQQVSMVKEQIDASKNMSN